MEWGETEKKAMFLFQSARQAYDAQDYPKATALVDEALSQFPNNPDFLTLKASSQASMGKIDEALFLLELIFKETPGWAPAKDLFGQLVNLSASQTMRIADYAAKNLPGISTVQVPGFDSGPGNAVSLYRLSNAQIIGSPGIIVTPERQLLFESVNDYNLQTALASAVRARSFAQPINKRPGEYCALYGVWAQNFFHWIMEWLPRAIVAERGGFTGTYLVPAHCLFARQSLELLGVPDHRIVDSTGENLQVDTLWITEDTSQSCPSYKLLLQSLRDTCLNASPVQRGKRGARRIYLERRNPDRRRILNEEHLLSIVKKFDITPVSMEQMNLSDQISTMRDCDVLIGAHGAGMVHSLFMKPGSLVIELFSPIYVNPCIMPVADLLKHRYFLAPSYRNFGPYTHGEDIEPFTQYIELTLRRELQA